MNIDHLYNLLPPIYRERDVAQGAPLQMLLRVITEQANVLEDDIAQLYENWFIETCEDWVVPYIGDLVGYRPVHQTGAELPGSNSALEQVLFPRREVASLVRYRRRKGTLSLLQEIAEAVSGWPARVVETGRLGAITQSLDHLDPDRGQSVDLRTQTALDALGTPFDRLARTADLAQENAAQCESRNTSGITVYAWRLRTYPVSHTIAYCLEEIGDHCFLFSITGNDTPLYNQPRTDAGTTSAQTMPDALQLPIPITRRALEQPVPGHPGRFTASELFYGEGRSIAVWAGDWAHHDPKLPVPASRIVPANLSDWAYRPEPGYIALDPELGRLSFPPGQLPSEVTVSYSYAFATEIGGGAYPRPLLETPGRTRIYSVGKGEHFRTIHTAYEAWKQDTQEALSAEPPVAPPHGILEIIDSSVYEERLHIELGEAQKLTLRAAAGVRPSIYLADWHVSHPDALFISGAAGSEFTLEGLLVSGRGIEVSGDLRSVTLRHCTLVPGWFLHADHRPARPGEPSITLARTSAALHVEHSILGPIRVYQEDPDAAPLTIHVRDSILDATHREHSVLSSSENTVAPAILSLHRCTVLGAIRTHAITLAENSILNGHVLVARRQIGCMRFCYVPADSRTPKRFHCQPDLALSTASQSMRHEHLPAGEREALLAAERRRVEPEFLSEHFGTPNFCRLADTNAPEILTGAEDEAELGVFHNLFQPQRQANLQARLDEYTPAGITALIVYAN